MIQTLSTFFDSDHFIHPLKQSDAGVKHKPSLLERISGVILAFLSVPFTLGIMTGVYLYWAHKKVVHIKSFDQIFQQVSEKHDKEQAAKVDAVKQNTMAEATEAMATLAEGSDQKEAFENVLLKYRWEQHMAKRNQTDEFDPDDKHHIDIINRFVAKIPFAEGQRLFATAREQGITEDVNGLFAKHVEGTPIPSATRI